MYPTPTSNSRPAEQAGTRHKPWFDRFRWGGLLCVIVAAVCTSLANSITQNLTINQTARAALVAFLVAFGGFILNPKKADWIPPEYPALGDKEDKDSLE